MLDTLGLGYFWQDQEIADIYLPTIKQRILDQYYQSWYRNINNSRRLSTYCRFKHSFNLEPYLDTIYERKFKIALTRFRLSSHRLEIERGRYFDIDRTERKCKNCTQNTIENEYHFLLVCPLYEDLRRKFLKAYYCNWPTLNKFDKLMTTTNKSEIINLAKYIYYAMKLKNVIET